MSSWLPYDEGRLESLLHSDRAELSHWLDDRRTLGALARARGFASMPALARRLIATRVVSHRQRRVLERRALDTLTQAHLARHVLFHIYHTPALAQSAQRVFGLSERRYRALRNQGLSPLMIAAEGHRTSAQLTTALTGLLLARRQRSVALQASSEAQARALLDLQRASLDVFIWRPYRTPAQQAQFVCQVHDY
jgi:hypothetical protein